MNTLVEDWTAEKVEIALENKERAYLSITPDFTFSLWIFPEIPGLVLEFVKDSLGDQKKFYYKDRMISVETFNELAEILNEEVENG